MFTNRKNLNKRYRLLNELEYIEYVFCVFTLLLFLAFYGGHFRYLSSMLSLLRRTLSNPLSCLYL